MPQPWLSPVQVAPLSIQRHWAMGFLRCRLKEVTVRLTMGSRIGVVGRNGAGKSTPLGAFCFCHRRRATRPRGGGLFYTEVLRDAFFCLLLFFFFFSVVHQRGFVV